MKSISVKKIGSTAGSISKKIGFYGSLVHKLLNYLQKHGWKATSLILTALLFEPWKSIKAGLLHPLSWKEHFNFHDLNPKSIEKHQAKKRPVLLLHGNYHNQSAWLDLAKKLKSSDSRPVYTVNLPNGSVTEDDYKIISKKIAQIKSHYKKHNIDDIKIDLIGHSRGGYLANRVTWNSLISKEIQNEIQSKDIGKNINIGHVLSQEELEYIKKTDPNYHDRVYEITGEYDIIITESSLLTSVNQRVVSSGHLGILYSHETHQYIMDWLKD